MASTLLKTLRVYQWPKNLLVFAALLFAEQLLIPHQVLRSLVAFAAFCAASSAMYIFNDLRDMEVDRIHPAKRHRPLASGAVSKGAGIALLGVCLGLAVVLSATLGVRFVLIVLVYVLLTASYTLYLKYVLLVDVLVVAMGFVVRAIAGAVALDVVFSDWLVVCTLFLALFLGLSKRRHEIALLDEEAIRHRAVLGQYTVAFLDSLNLIVAGATLITYTIYTCSPEVVERLGTDKMYLTLPFVVYGLFRYLYLVHVDHQGGDPSQLLLQDRSLGVAVVLWGLACVGIIYAGRSVGF